MTGRDPADGRLLLVGVVHRRDERRRHGRWETPPAALAAAWVPVVLADGPHDPVPVPGRAAEVAARHRNVTAATHPTAGHQLPITHPSWCVNLLGGLAR